MRPPSAMPWPSSAVNSGPRRLSPPPRIPGLPRRTETLSRRAQPPSGHRLPTALTCKAKLRRLQRSHDEARVGFAPGPFRLGDHPPPARLVGHLLCEIWYSVEASSCPELSHVAPPKRPPAPAHRG